jgi:hypothetical protein
MANRSTCCAITNSSNLLFSTEHVKSSVFTSDCLVKDPNNVLFFGCRRLATISQILMAETPQQSLLKVKVISRSTVSRPACLGVRPPSGTRDQYFFLLEILFRHLRVCCYWARCLTRGRAILVRVILRSTVSRPVCLGVRPPSGTKLKKLNSVV